MTLSQKKRSASRPDEVIRHAVSPDCSIVLQAEAPAPVSRDTNTRIEELWQAALRDASSTLYDGPLYSVVELHPNQITVSRTSYRKFIAQSLDRNLFDDLQIRPIAVTAVLSCVDGLIFGRRSSKVAFDKNMWELGPSGTLDDEAMQANGTLDYLTVLEQELAEELGLTNIDTSLAHLLAVHEDTVLKAFDVAVRVRTSLTERDVLSAFATRPTTEYTDIKIVPATAFSDFASACAEDITPLCLQILSSFELT